MTEKHEKKKVKYKKLPTFVADGCIYESVVFDDMPMFLKWDGKNFLLHNQPIVLNSGYEIIPLEKIDYPYLPYVVTEKQIQNPKRIGFDELLHDVYIQFSTYLDLEQRYKLLSSLKSFETYHQHKMHSLSYLYYFGDHDSGKTQACDTHKAIDYRPLFGISISDANIYRYIGREQEGHCTIIEDEAQVINLRKHDRKLQIYRAGYKKGATVPIVHDYTRKQQFFNTYCSKIFAGSYIINDAAFRQRVVPIPMVYGDPKKDEIDIGNETFTDLRLRLLLHRMIHYFDPLPQFNVELKGRTKELWKGIIETMNLTERYKKLIGVVEKMAKKYEEDKIKRRRETLPAYLTEVLTGNYIHLCGYEVPFSMIWAGLMKRLGITEWEEGKKVKSELLGRGISPHEVGLKMTSIFNAERNLRTDIGRTYKFEAEVLRRLCKKFQLVNVLNDLNDFLSSKNKQLKDFNT